MILAAFNGVRRAKAHLHNLARLSGFVLLRFWYNNGLQSAAALTYMALLALVPLMTITLGLLSAFPAFQEFEAASQAWIFSNLVPQVGEAVQEYLQGFVGKAGELTAMGIVGLVVASVLLLMTIEDAFNAIWRVTEPRPLFIRLLAFWAVLTMTPILFATSLSLTSQLLPRTVFDEFLPIRRQLIGVLPFLFEFVGLAVLYRIIPNRPILNRDAIIGAVIAAALFETSKAGFAAYLTAFPVYQTIYGALSIFPTFLVWLYLASAVVLFGAVVAAALPDWRAGKLVHGGVQALLPAQRILIALAVLHELREANRLGVSITRKTILHRVPLAAALVDDVLDELRHARFVQRTADDGWLLSRDPSATTLHDLVRGLGIGFRGAASTIRELRAPWQTRATELLTQADATQGEVLGVTLNELFAEAPDDTVSSLRRERRR